MRRENKLALIVGFSVLLVVAVLVSDHLSQARRDEVGDGLDSLARLPDEGVLFDTVLSGESRVIPGEPTRAEAVTEADPLPVETPVETTTRLTQAMPPVVEPIPQTDRVEVPMVLSNGPAAADRLVQNPMLESRGGRSDLLGLDIGKMKALLERARSRPATKPGEKAQPVNGHIESAGKYVVQPGDTLYEICQNLYGDGDRWHDMVTHNKGKVRPDGTVFVGVTLDLLPGAKSTNSAPPAEKTRRDKPSAKTRRYTVKKGDTLGEIAQREVGSVRHLAAIRDLNPSLKKNKDRIMIGQTLVLPARRAG